MLGLHIDSGNTNHTALDKLLTRMGIVTHLIRRVSTRRDGMRQPNLLRLLQSFVMSQVSYIGAFQQWLQHEQDKINAAIRKSHKTALGLLHSTSNRALASLGVHHTLEEVCEAQRFTQLARLGTTKVGRVILQRAGLRPPRTEPLSEDTHEHRKIPNDIARQLVVPLLPRNVHPDHNKERT